jgi:hypothetical protein
MQRAIDEVGEVGHLPGERKARLSAVTSGIEIDREA